MTIINGVNDMIKKALHTFNPADYHPSTVIGEFSGRDSVAAIIKAMEDESVSYILPIASFAGTEHGDFDVIYDNYLHLKKRIVELHGDSKTLYPLIEYSQEDIWAAMNGRPSTILINRFGFHSPCIGCHLYFHLTKIKFANALSGKIISGERESHDGRLKVNQLGKTLDAYIEVMTALGFELLMPLRHIVDGDVVEALIGWDWKEGLAHPECVLSGNYRDSKGKAVFEEDVLEAYLDAYIKPVGMVVGSYILEEQEAIHELKEKVMATL